MTERSLAETTVGEGHAELEAFGNARRALQYINRVARGRTPLTEETIKAIQRRCSRNLLPEDASGRYRTLDVGVTQASFTPPPWQRVPELMNLYIDEVGRKLSPCGCGVKCLPAVVAAVSFSMYALFRIHPFEDGNGRTARLMGDLILKRFGFRPIIVWPSGRDKYIASLEAVHRSGNLAHFELFLADRLLERYKQGRNGAGTSEVVNELGVLIAQKKSEVEAQNATKSFAAMWPVFADPCFD